MATLDAQVSNYLQCHRLTTSWAEFSTSGTTSDEGSK